MRIVSSQMALGATHVSEVSRQRKESLLAWVGARPRAEPAASSERFAAADAPPPTLNAPAVASAPGGAHGERDVGCESGGDGAQVLLDGRLSDYLVLLRMLDPESRRMLAARLATLDDLQRACADVQSVALPQAPRPGEGGPVGWGVEYDLHEESRVAETTRFGARGEVTTSDGRHVAMELELEMARVEVQTRSVSVRAGDARKVDPLVVNLGAGPATFEGSHRFDLDGDGRTEEIARLSGTSAYLARDLNGDGRINDGRELFGPATGDGFAELASHDSDGNGWIDEADPVFRELLLWRPAAGGTAGTTDTAGTDGTAVPAGAKDDAKAPAPTGTLTSATAAGLGALYVGRVATPFSVQSGGQEQAQIGETSVYLREDGTAGSVQHVDLVV